MSAQGNVGAGGGCAVASAAWVAKRSLWLLGAIAGWLGLLWLVSLTRARGGHAYGLDLFWPLHYQQGLLVVLPTAEVTLGFGGLAVYCWRSTLAQLPRRRSYVWVSSDDFDPTDESVAQVVLGLANMPKEVTSWGYWWAMATRTSLMAWGQGKVAVVVSVPAERAGEPILAATDQLDADLRPLEEFVLPQEPVAATAVPVEEVPDV